jgi:hypothetical protein
MLIVTTEKIHGYESKKRLVFIWCSRAKFGGNIVAGLSLILQQVKDAISENIRTKTLRHFAQCFCFRFYQSPYDYSHSLHLRSNATIKFPRNNIDKGDHCADNVSIETK